MIFLAHMTDKQMPDKQMPDKQMPDKQMPDKQMPDKQMRGLLTSEKSSGGFGALDLANFSF
jgi:hypothetical protein